jgi:hypothetical protein
MNQKLDVPTVIERTWDIYRDQFTLLIPAALLVFIPVALVSGLLIAAGGVLAVLPVLLIAAAATYWYQGMVVEAARDILDGRRDHDVGSLFRSVGPVVLPLAGASILAGIATAIGFILLIVPGLILLTIWALIAPVIVLERAGALDSFGRSRALVKGSGWQVFGVILTFFVLQFVLSRAVQAIFGAVSDSFVVYSLADLAVRVAIAPLAGLAAAVMYFELKKLRGEPIPGQEAVTTPQSPPPAAAG